MPSGPRRRRTASCRTATRRRACCAFWTGRGPGEAHPGALNPLCISPIGRVPAPDPRAPMMPSPAEGAPPLAYGLPFAGLLLSIALLPLVRPHWWERRFPLVTAAWALLFALPFAALRGAEAAGEALLGAVAHE